MTIHKDVVIVNPDSIKHKIVDVSKITIKTNVVLINRDEELLGRTFNIREQNGKLIADLEINDPEFEFDPNSLSAFVSNMKLSEDGTVVESCILRTIYIWNAPKVVL